jgi:hypothetical protein
VKTANCNQVIALPTVAAMAVMLALAEPCSQASNGLHAPAPIKRQTGKTAADFTPSGYDGTAARPALGDLNGDGKDDLVLFVEPSRENGAVNEDGPEGKKSYLLVCLAGKDGLLHLFTYNDRNFVSWIRQPKAAEEI